MSFVFETTYDGDRAELYNSGTDTGVRRFIVSRDDGGIQSGAVLTPAEFLAAGGEQLAKAQAKLVSGTTADRVAVSRFGSSPNKLVVTVYQSDNGFFDDLVPEDDVATPNSVYTAATSRREFEIPYLTGVEIPFPGSDTPVTVQQRQSYTDTTPITVIDVETFVATWTYGGEQAFVNGLANSLHNIDGNVYRFLGVSSVRSAVGGGYTVRYQWEFDIGSRFVEPDVSTVCPTNLPDPFGDITIANRLFTGPWWRPPYCKVLIAPVPTEVQLPFIVGTTTLCLPTPSVFIDGVLGQETSWQGLPGNPIQ